MIFTQSARIESSLWEHNLERFKTQYTPHTHKDKDLLDRLRSTGKATRDLCLLVEVLREEARHFFRGGLFCAAGVCGGIIDESPAAVQAMKRASIIWEHRRGLLALSLASLAVYQWQAHQSDVLLGFEAARRMSRSGWCAFRIAFNYKTTSPSVSLEEQHRWAARKLLELFSVQRGLYIKIGQSIASLDYILPAEYCETMRPLFQMAPQSNRQDLERVWEEEMGGKFGVRLKLDDLFEEVRWERPLGTASLAQVVGARLRPAAVQLLVQQKGQPQDGSEEFFSKHPQVAIKIQHPDVRRNARLDIATVGVVLRALSWVFPDQAGTFQWLVAEMRRSVPVEMDFANEAANAERMRNLIASDRDLSQRVYVPRVWWPGTTARVLTMELVQAGAPVIDGAFCQKHRIDRRELAGLVNRLYARMIFRWGLLHCDPHPGNLLLTLSEESLNWRLALIDHGLYREIPDEFRLAFGSFWRALMWGDEEGMERASLALGSDAHRLLSAIVTHRPWSAIEKNGNPRGDGIFARLRMFAAGPSDAERELIRERMPMYFGRIGKVLGEIPRPLLLVFKVNDILASINRILLPAKAAIVCNLRAILDECLYLEYSNVKSDFVVGWLLRWFKLKLTQAFMHSALWFASIE